MAERQAQARKRRGLDEIAVVLRDPPARKIFHIFTGDHDFGDEQSYAAVTCELRSVGKHCQAYVDRDGPWNAELQATVADAIRTFDDSIVPRFASWGEADVDRDGRFTLVFSPRLSKLQNGRVSVSGFVRGSDFLRDVIAPFGNQCDVMFLNTDLKSGPYLRTVMVHEYLHAVVFSEHVFGDYLPGVERRDEDSWLNEGLAHLAEFNHGHSWANLDYRISGFLNAPERHSLEISDYYARGLWRTPGPRGASFLFLHGLSQRLGPDFAVALVQSNLHGVANLEAAAGERYPDLFRSWCVGLAANRDVFSTPQGAAHEGSVTARTGASATLTSCPAPPRYLLAGPRLHELEPHGEFTLDLAGSAAGYFLVKPTRAGRTRLTITGSAQAQLQVTVIRQPRTPRLHIRCFADRKLRSLRVEVTAGEKDLWLEEMAWELENPTGDPAQDTNWRPSSDGSTGAGWFGSNRLAAGESRLSPSLSGISTDTPLVVKVRARDTQGRKVVAWALAEW